MAKKKKKRNAIRLGPDPHSVESVEFTVDRYGKIDEELAEDFCALLKRCGYKFETTMEGSDITNMHILITVKVGAMLKYFDNKKDVLMTIERLTDKLKEERKMK